MHLLPGQEGWVHDSVRVPRPTASSLTSLCHAPGPPGATVRVFLHASAVAQPGGWGALRSEIKEEREARGTYTEQSTPSSRPPSKLVMLKQTEKNRNGGETTPEVSPGTMRLMFNPVNKDLS